MIEKNNVIFICKESLINSLKKDSVIGAVGGGVYGSIVGGLSDSLIAMRSYKKKLKRLKDQYNNAKSKKEKRIIQNKILQLKQTEYKKIRHSAAYGGLKGGAIGAGAGVFKGAAIGAIKKLTSQ